MLGLALHQYERIGSHVGVKQCAVPVIPFTAVMSQKTLATLHKRLQPPAIKKMPLAAPPPRDNRFSRPLELAKAHWVRPELVAEITYLSWPEDGLLRHTVFVGLREDKPAREVQRERPTP
jgi:ATP-dependent DNA ligase